MNFRSLLINLYLNLKGNSEALSEGVTGLIRGTRRVLEYAPRTPKCRHSQQVASDDARSDVFRTSTPRVRARLSLYKRNPKAADSFANFSSSFSHFASVCVPEIPRSPGIVLKPRSKSRDPEDPEKCGSRAEALPARSSIFEEIFQIC